jgi:hypothetical protein
LILDVVAGLRWGKGLPGLNRGVWFRTHPGAGDDFQKRAELVVKACSQQHWLGGSLNVCANRAMRAQRNRCGEDQVAHQSGGG